MADTKQKVITSIQFNISVHHYERMTLCEASILW